MTRGVANADDKSWEQCAPLLPFLAYVQKERKAWVDSQQLYPRGERRLRIGWAGVGTGT